MISCEKGFLSTAVPWFTDAAGIVSRLQFRQLPKLSTTHFSAVWKFGSSLVIVLVNLRLEEDKKFRLCQNMFLKEKFLFRSSQCSRFMNSVVLWKGEGWWGGGHANWLTTKGAFFFILNGRPQFVGFLAYVIWKSFLKKIISLKVSLKYLKCHRAI